MKSTRPLKISDADIIRRTAQVPIGVKALLAYRIHDDGTRGFTLISLALAHCQMRIYALTTPHGITFKALAHEARNAKGIVLGMGPHTARTYLRRLITNGYLAVDRQTTRTDGATAEGARP
jgi:hypothetical protein